MNELFFREVPMPGGCRGFVVEDEEGDFNIYINKDLSDERKQKTAAHELEHIRRGDLSSDLAAHALEKILAEFDK